MRPNLFDTVQAFIAHPEHVDKNLEAHLVVTYGETLGKAIMLAIVQEISDRAGDPDLPGSELYADSFGDTK